MVDAVSVALSGLLAQGQRLAVAANNIANAGTAGVLPTAGAPASTVYKPLYVSMTALATGGVQAVVREDSQGYSPAFDPSSAYANSEGLVAVPNVDLVKESVNILEVKSLYKANVAVLKTQEKLLGELLNAIS